MLPRVAKVRYVDGYRLELQFTDGIQGVIDFRQRIVGRGGVFKPLEEIDFFKRVAVEPEAGTIMWPNEVDLCPDVLYSLVTGKTIPELEIAIA
jgi:hypothetical protein